MKPAAFVARLLVGLALMTPLSARVHPVAPDHLQADVVRSIAASGNEIGGGTNPYQLRTTSSGATVAHVETVVAQVQDSGGGRIPESAASHRGEATPLSRRPAWTVLGFGIGQVQILFSGLLMATAVVGTYRVATRGSRYGR